MGNRAIRYRTEADFWATLDRTEGGCWERRGKRMANGYAWAAGESFTKIAPDYNTSRQHIGRIVTGKVWKDAAA